ncbi:GDYXXLXY domain-containing protein [Paenibacillus koleovorans]|uniref:GDYXXLXY domain-containing protein n=1 Tax=Paenibacillus koleovorans TaxID=121608 RepID=UPI001FE7777F|nr:GDYXXLXY domain-containing protein [Paenibacillus koleovorans]
MAMADKEIPTGKKRNRRPGLLLALVLAQMLFLLGLAGSYYAVGWWGKEIRLQTVPVDPRDLLYGDYVTLQYEISRLKPELWKGGGEQPEQGDVVYVVVKPGGNGVHSAAGIYGDKPSVGEGEAVLKGRVDYSWNEAIVVKYGLERYYIPEGTGKELEQRAGDLIVQVKVASWGQSRIVGLE